MVIRIMPSGPRSRSSIVGGFGKRFGSTCVVVFVAAREVDVDIRLGLSRIVLYKACRQSGDPMPLEQRGLVEGEGGYSRFYPTSVAQMCTAALGSCRRMPEREMSSARRHKLSRDVETAGQCGRSPVEKMYAETRSGRFVFVIWTSVDARHGASIGDARASATGRPGTLMTRFLRHLLWPMCKGPTMPHQANQGRPSQSACLGTCTYPGLGQTQSRGHKSKYSTIYESYLSLRFF